MNEIGMLFASSSECERKVKARSPVSRALGGINVWAPTERTLDVGLRALQTLIEQCASTQLTCTRSVLKKLVQEQLGRVTLRDKVFSAALGASLRSGHLDSIVCASKSDETFRVLIHQSQVDRWYRVAESTRSQLKLKGVLHVRDLEGRIFANRAYNTWSSSSHVLAALSHRGVLEQVANDTYQNIASVL